jgi:hypothetical protein
MDRRGRGAADSCATINWNEKFDDLGLFLAIWNWECRCPTKKETFTCQFFVDKIIDNFDKELAETRPKKRARGTFLHLDNAPTHRADDDFDRLGITRLPHLPYIQDLAPCDFWLFGNLKTKLEGNTFTNTGQIMVKVNEIPWTFLSMSLSQFLMNGSADLPNASTQEGNIFQLS